MSRHGGFKRLHHLASRLTLCQLPHPPAATAPGPVHTAISHPALMAKFRSEVDSLPLSWSTRGRRATFASYHCCTLIHKRAQYLAFLSPALLAPTNRPPLRLTLAGAAWYDPRTPLPIPPEHPPPPAP